ncbi:unnamed protein product [Didymodactylos carnosus]|uniref:Uncharacterized protein n=1 Tax=Didymodactylos carnosus TaxID=1234261 RepID=A0A815S5E7_9BILA|nr:unnamed protein product [Didymodactylos carnosus]CAF1485135.1 unnamed protein product [Didymodactylos carnosus]CAF4200002.1 unnamed protein product [Didymodactylos carnosus]CAF4349331.1 unnamed protein product [Didymodactylos carnosus]
MAGRVGNDDEEQRVINRIRANVYREAMEKGAAFINRKWIAQKLHHTERWVTDNWKKDTNTALRDLAMKDRQNYLKKAKIL